MGVCEILVAAQETDATRANNWSAMGDGKTPRGIVAVTTRL
jgi:hypothetical protein